MRNYQTPWTHTGILGRDLEVEFKPSGSRLTHTLVVPAGTICHMLEGGDNPWVVGDLQFITDKRSILYHDAEHYGIHIPEDEIIDIEPIARPMMGFR